MKWLAFFLIQISSFLFAFEQTSYPYLSGYTWFFFADWRLTGPDGGRGRVEDFVPENIKLGDTIFVDFGYFDLFIEKYLPRIQNQFILITSNYGSGDAAVPGRFGHLAFHPKIYAWFLQNLDREPEGNLIPIPIGLASRHWLHGNTNVFQQVIEDIQIRKPSKTIPIYVNLTYRPERADCIEYFQNMKIPSEKFKCLKKYLQDLARSEFVICPRGNGLDTHRLWEALLMGSYPVVQTSTLDSLYEDLPVVVINRWDEVTPEFLRQKKLEFQKESWKLAKLYAPYWFDKVREKQAELRGN